MSQNPSVRSIREALLVAHRGGEVDPVVLETLQADILARIEEIRRAMDRAFDFATRGLISEAASVVTDFPDLAREAEALIEIATADALASPAWRAIVGDDLNADRLPHREEVDRLAGIALRADELRTLLDALRLSALRREPIKARMLILRKLRNEDLRNRMWLDQIEALEVEWLRSISELRSRVSTREELDEALVALESHDWVAGVPRGLREELLVKVKPLRAAEAGTRYAGLADEIHAAGSRMDRADLIRLEKEWASVHQETGRMPADELVKMVAPAFAWLSRIEAEEAEQRTFEGEVDRLETMLSARRGVAEIEAQIAVLRDSGRAAPEGLLARAVRYVDAERESARRRHRLVLTGSILGAVVLVTVGAIALSIHSARREREALLVSLREAVAAKDTQRLGRLVLETRDAVQNPGPELSAALAEADTMLAARAARTAEIRQFLASAEKELAGQPDRARIEALRKSLADAMADAESEDSGLVRRVESQRIAVLESLDASAVEVTSKSLEDVDRALLAWPLPDTWLDVQALDESRWDAYLASLAEIRRQLDATETKIDGHEASVGRIGIKRDAVDKRIAEAKGRAESLQLARKELAADKLLAPISSEAQWLDRLNAAIATHSPNLAREGLLPAFEQAVGCAGAYQAMETWRTVVRPKLAAALGQNLAERPSPDIAAGVANEIRGFVGAHPEAPMCDVLTRIANDIDPTTGTALWSPERISVELAKEGIAKMDEVKVAGNLRFYRRPPATANAPAIQRDPSTRALKSLADLSADPEKLSSMLAVARDDIQSTSVENPVSVAWGRAERVLSSARYSEALPLMLELSSSILAENDSEVLLRFRSLRTTVAILLESGHATGRLRDALSAWKALCERTASAALSADWVLAAYDPELINWRRARAEATKALDSFPKLAELRAEAETESKIIGDVLAALVPVGLAGPQPANGDPRETRVSGLVEDLYVLARRGVDWVIVPIPTEQGRIGKMPEGVPAGPVLIYRRNR